MQDNFFMRPEHNWNNMPSGHDGFESMPAPQQDNGPWPYALDIDAATKQNNTYRTTLWTGHHLQLTLMSINPGEDIGLEVHPHLDQFIRVEQGHGTVLMGDRPDNMYFRQPVGDGWAFIIPANTYHNLVNMGRQPLKLYSIYAPPQHPPGTVHRTRADAMAAEEHH